MNVSWGDPGDVEKFFEQQWEGEPEPIIELLLGEVDSVVRRFFSRHGLSAHKVNEHAIRDAEAFVELPHVQLVHRFFRMDLSGRIFAALPGRTRRSSVLVRKHFWEWG